MPKPKLTYGLRNNELTHVSKVERGISCACFCPSCGHPLVARKGTKTAHHFSHHHGGECANAVETALHLAAKKIISKEKSIVIPKVPAEFYPGRDPVILSPEQTIELDEVIEEKRTENLIPDIIAIKKGIKLFIEIRVTHEVDEVKLAKIRKLGISAIEIDLSKEEREFTQENLRDMVIFDVSNRSWLYNVKSEKAQNDFLSFGEEKESIFRDDLKDWLVGDCPIGAQIRNGKSYANSKWDCVFCEYCYDVSNMWRDVICFGRNKIKTYENLKKALNDRSENQDWA